jgi:hypothetical protein
MRFDGFADLTEELLLLVRSVPRECDVALADGDARYPNTGDPVRDSKRTSIGAAEVDGLG